MDSITALTQPDASLLIGQAGEIAPGAQGKDLAEQLEAVFISMLIKEMRTSGSEEGLFAGDASDTFGGMFDSFMGDHIAASGGLGLRRMLELQLPGATGPDSTVRRLAQEAYQNGIASGNEVVAAPGQ